MGSRLALAPAIRIYLYLQYLLGGIFYVYLCNGQERLRLNTINLSYFQILLANSKSNKKFITYQLAMGQETKATDQTGSARLPDEEAISYILLAAWCSLSAVIALWNVWCKFIECVRAVVSIYDHNQYYFAMPSYKLSFFKRNILYAPIWQGQSREFKFSNTVTLGILPYRLELFFIVGYFATNFILCVIHTPFTGSLPDAAGQLRKRTGCFAVVNMVGLNPVSVISSEKYLAIAGIC